MQVAYITRKVFADDSEEIRIKINKQITPGTIAKAKETRKQNKFLNENRIAQIKKQIHQLRFYDPQYSRKLHLLENELKLRNIQNVCRSAHRSRQALYDICRCNEFKFFVTFTNDPEKIDRNNDKLVKRKFTQWANDIRKKFPNMYYVAVPEYHKKGALHFHLLIGGVTFEELGCVPALTKRGRLKFKNGKQIFNVTAWKWGFSTLSIIENVEASKHYICKYISKQHFDGRFFNKRRYYASHNIKRPLIEKRCVKPEDCLNGIDDNVYLVEYLNPEKQYLVLSYDGNGIVNETMNAPAVKEDLQALRGRRSRAACPPDRAARVPYLTVGTLNREFTEFMNSLYKKCVASKQHYASCDWQYEKKYIERVFFKTLRDFRQPHEDYDCEKWQEQTILDEYYANMAVKPCRNEKSDIEYCREVGLID